MSRMLFAAVLLVFASKSAGNGIELRNLKGFTPNFGLELPNYAAYIADDLKAKSIELNNGLGMCYNSLRFPGLSEIYGEGIAVDKPIRRGPKEKFNDPNYPEQWALGNAKIDYMNIQRAWRRGYTGKNITICFVDDGIDYRHPDLRRRYRPDLSYDFNDLHDIFHDPTTQYSSMRCLGHGTMCAGVAAAEANNGVCGVGVAYDAYISAFRMLDGEINLFMECRAITYLSTKIDIKCFSWGPTDDGTEMSKPGKLSAKALEFATSRGRNGLGTLLIWAAGNGGDEDHGGADAYHTNPHVFAFTAVKQNGRHEEFAEASPCIFAATYSGEGISKTNRHWDGLCTTLEGNKCDCDFSGTSAAAPMAAGILALVLQANPRLSYRDVMHLIAETALKPPKPDRYWITNAAGYHLHDYIGFGTLDADGMVEKALNWRPVSKRLRCEIYSIISLSKSQLSFDEYQFIWKIRFGKCGIKRIEHVVVEISADAIYRGGVKISLESPSRTKTVLLDYRKHDRSNKGIRNQPFTTNRCWGEKPDGVWTLRATVKKLSFYGLAANKFHVDGFYIYGNV